jgi:ribosomal-protein-alanine N-acetyltransferase
MRLRAAGADEAGRLAEIHATAFAKPWQAEELAGFMAERGAFALAAESEGELAGFILCRTIAGEAEVLTLAVRPELRRRGAGRALLEAAMQTSAPVAGAMLLEVAADNPSAIALYRQAGFEAVGRRAAYYVSGRTAPADALVMRRALNS